MYRPSVALLLLLLGVAACSRRSAAEQNKEDEVVYVKGDDPAMSAAIAKAQATLSAFKAALATPSPGVQHFSVKVGFPYNAHDDREHIWLSEPKLSDTTVTGTINNQPVDVTNLKLGQVVTAPLKDVSDWMYVEGGVLRGGYTLRAMLDKMSPEDRKKMLAEMGARLD